MTSSQAPHGFLLLDKPQGPTSHGLVAMTRKALGTRKIGHAGTLDPMATGLMILGVGGATRLLTHITGADKDYEATVRFGATTTTEDAEGHITATAPQAAIDAITEARITEAMRALTGRIMQIPSAVSAIRVDGVRAHKRVRDGEQVELAPREIEVSSLRLRAIMPAPGAEHPALDAQISVSCSSGTYVRALARDLGNALGTGAHLTRLRRTRVGPFRITEATPVHAGQPAPPGLHERLMTPAEAAGRLFPVLRASSEEALALRQGKRVPLTAAAALTAPPEAEPAAPARTPASGAEHAGPERAPASGAEHAPPAPAAVSQPERAVPARAAVIDPHGTFVGLAELHSIGGRTIARPVLNMPVQDTP